MFEVWLDPCGLQNVVMTQDLEVSWIVFKMMLQVWEDYLLI